MSSAIDTCATLERLRNEQVKNDVPPAIWANEPYFKVGDKPSVAKPSVSHLSENRSPSSATHDNSAYRPPLRVPHLGKPLIRRIPWYVFISGQRKLRLGESHAAECSQTDGRDTTWYLFLGVIAQTTAVASKRPDGTRA